MRRWLAALAVLLVILVGLMYVKSDWEAGRENTLELDRIPEERVGVPDESAQESAVPATGVTGGAERTTIPPGEPPAEVLNSPYPD